MNTYKLTAIRNGVTRSKTIYAIDDNQAIFEAVFEILDKATRSEIWANGRIELRDEAGNLLKEMAEK